MSDPTRENNSHHPPHTDDCESTSSNTIGNALHDYLSPVPFLDDTTAFTDSTFVLCTGSNSSDHYTFRVPRFARKPRSRPLRPVEKRESLKDRSKKSQFTKHTRSKPVLDGSDENFDAMMKKIQRYHRRRKNHAFISQQFEDILEDLFDGSIWRYNQLVPLVSYFIPSEKKQSKQDKI